MPVNYDRLKELARPKTYTPITEIKRMAVSLKQLAPSIERLSKPRIQQNLKKESILNSRHSQVKQSTVDDVSKPQTTVELCKNTIHRKSLHNKRDEIPSLQIKNETKSDPATAGKRHGPVTARDHGEGGKADGDGKKADLEGGKADGDGAEPRAVVECLCTAGNEGDRPQLTPVHRATTVSDERQTATVSLMDFLSEHSERLSMIHAECRRERWPDECRDAGVSVAGAGVAGAGAAAGGRGEEVSSAPSRPLRRLAAYSERFRRNVCAACLAAAATLGGFFRRIGRVTAAFGFHADSAVHSGTVLAEGSDSLERITRILPE